MVRKQRSAEEIERVQVGIRLEKRMIKVLKGLAEYFDLSLNELVEDMLLHELEGNGANCLGKPHLKIVADLKKLYGMNYDTHASYRWRESGKNLDV